MRDCLLRWCTTGSKRRTRRLTGPARSDRTCVRPSILITTYSEILCGVLWRFAPDIQAWRGAALLHISDESTFREKCGAQHSSRSEVSYSKRGIAPFFAIPV